MTDLTIVFLAIGGFLAAITGVMIYFAVRIRDRDKKNKEFTQWVNKRYEKKGENQ